MKKYVFIVLAFISWSYSCMATGVRTKHDISSPDNSVLVSFSENNGALVYNLKWNGEQIIDQSKLSIFSGKEIII